MTACPPLATAAVAAPRPIRLRPAVGQRIGTTAFFRNRPLLRAVLDAVAELEQPRLRVLCHAGSVGAGIYSFLIACALDERLQGMEIDAAITDIEPRFLEVAGEGLYPKGVLAGMTPAERAFFQEVAPDAVRIDPAIRARLRVLPAASFTAPQSEPAYDLVFLLNALLYVEAAEQRRAIAAIAAYNRHLLVTTGFHLDSIERDLSDHGYRPLSDGIEAIHEAWLDRRIEVAGEQRVPGVIFHPWSLPRFSRIDGYEYRYGALFAKQDTGGA